MATVISPKKLYTFADGSWDWRIIEGQRFAKDGSRIQLLIEILNIKIGRHIGAGRGAQSSAAAGRHGQIRLGRAGGEEKEGVKWGVKRG